MKRLLAIGILLGIACVSSAICLWIVLTNRGVYADETGTGGYTTGLDFVMIAFIIISFIASMAFFIRAIQQKWPGCLVGLPISY